MPPTTIMLVAALLQLAHADSFCWPSAAGEDSPPGMEGTSPIVFVGRKPYPGAEKCTKEKFPQDATINNRCYIVGAGGEELCTTKTHDCCVWIKTGVDAAEGDMMFWLIGMISLCLSCLCCCVIVPAIVLLTVLSSPQRSIIKTLRTAFARRHCWRQTRSHR